MDHEEDTLLDVDYEEEYFLPFPPCGETMANFMTSYGKFHNYIVLVLCLVGCVGNVVNATVLTSRRMRAPIDVIFTALAVAHLLLLLALAPSALTDTVTQLQLWRDQQTISWAVYKVVEINVILGSRLIATWLTLSLLVWGTIQVARPHRARHLCTMRRAIKLSVCAYLVCPLLCVPLYMSLRIVTGYSVTDSEGSTVEHFDSNVTSLGANATRIYRWELTDLATARDYLLMDVNSWLHRVILVGVACVALAVTTAWMMYASWRRPRGVTALLTSAREDEEAVTPSDTPTKLLTVMAALYLLFNLPVAILTILEESLDEPHFLYCHEMLSQLIGMASLIYPAATCWLYCALRREYWDTLVYLVKPRCLDRGGGGDLRGSSSATTQITMTLLT